jgi:hypothetical protein
MVWGGGPPPAGGGGAPAPLLRLPFVDQDEGKEQLHVR